MRNKKENILKLPDNFWKIKRPDVDFKDTFRDVTPINWNKNEFEDIFVSSAREKNKIIFSDKQ